MSAVDLVEGLDRVGRAAAPHLEIAGAQAVLALDRELHHGKALGGRGAGARLVRRA
jgi:hypothetical protein